MRFFAHDGKTVHGPAALEELLKLPGFDGDTLVCPVGSENSSDWKPALAYPPFRSALLAPAPKSAPPPAAPAAPERAAPCRRCMRANPADARFCNACGFRLDGRGGTPSPMSAPAADPDRLASPPEPAPETIQLVSFPIPPESSEPAPDTGTETPASAAPAPKRRVVWIAAVSAAAIASAALAWRLHRPVRPETPPIEASAPAPIPAVPTPPTAAPVPNPPPPAPPVPAPAPATTVRRAMKAPAPRFTAKRARRKTHLQPKPAPEASVPTAAAAAAAAENDDFLMPGVPRRARPQSAAKPQAGAAAAAAAAAAPPDASPAAAPDDDATHQVREQFQFCAQLLAQADYGDHFDTCLCADARQAAPDGGSRDGYMAAMKKASDAGTLETAAAVAGIVIEGSTAKVTANWKAEASGSARTTTESWRLDDGLWCRTP